MISVYITVILKQFKQMALCSDHSTLLYYTIHSKYYQNLRVFGATAEGGLKFHQLAFTTAYHTSSEWVTWLPV